MMFALDFQDWPRYMLGLMILVLYFFMWRPESKRRKQMAQFRAGLKKGDKIITAGGIYVQIFCGIRKRREDQYFLVFDVNWLLNFFRK